MAQKGSILSRMHSIFRTNQYDPDSDKLRIPFSFMGSMFDGEELSAVDRVIRSGWLTTGEETVAFEEEFAALHQVEHAFTASNCTTALHMAAHLSLLEEGDEVVTTPLTFISTNQAVLMRGATPVFTDVDPRTWNIEPERIAEAVNSRTRAIFLTHLLGQMCDMQGIMSIAQEHGLLVIEDCAHAQGATYFGRPAGSIGDAGCFSFHAVKNMSTLGEGGMITTTRDDWGLKIPWLRSMGSRYPDDYNDDGTPGPRPYDIDDVDGVIPSNLRMSDVQAAVGRVQLKKLPMLLAKRRAIAERWSEAIASVPGINPPHIADGVEHTFHIYAISVDPERAGFDADALSDLLRHDYGVGTRRGVFKPNYLFALYRRRGYAAGLCPVAERAWATTLQLPLNPTLTDEEVELVADAVGQAARRLRS